MKLTTPPLAPKVIQALAKLNVHTVQDVQAMNPCRAFLLLKQLGLSVTKSVFWQLVALGSLKTKGRIIVGNGGGVVGGYIRQPENRFWGFRLPVGLGGLANAYRV